MRKIDVIETEKIDNSISITYDSDLHYVPEMKLDYLYRQYESLDKDPTTYYFFLGDLINDSRIDVFELRKLKDAVAKISKTKTKVYFILGNCDRTTRVNGYCEEYYNKEYIDMIKDIDGVSVLENEMHQDGKIVIHGVSFSSDYYYEKEPIEECCNILDGTLMYGKDTFNILLSHSPYRIFDKNICETIPNFLNTDIVFAGHFHNGLVPSYLDKFFPGNYGIVAYKKFFPDNARGKRRITSNTTGFISSPITTFSNHHGHFTKLNVLYPPTEQKVIIKKKI